ncbi:uncharacterized protein [Diabrotica undecimpunctata]|uniref:uncharacterized protein n=1 Tax=Diabrotica undecimpunctata TaxID=50387 RepID=UPI003B632BB2
MECYKIRIGQSGEPIDNRRLSTSGVGDVKWATGLNATGNQVAGAQRTTGTLNKISFRKTNRFGTWNIRGLIQHPGKLHIIEREMADYRISMLGISETYWKGKGHFRSASGNTIYFSGHQTESINGVAIIIPPTFQNYVNGYDAVNDRIIHLRLKYSTSILHIIQIYAPTATAEQATLEDFYMALEGVLDKIPNKDIVVVLGDFNAKLGRTNLDDHMKMIVGPYGLGDRNERGDRLLEFCNQRKFSVMNTHFKHHPRAECGSDHQLLMADYRIRFKNIRKASPRSFRLTDPELAIFKERIEPALTRIENNRAEQSVDEAWTDIKETIVTTVNQCRQPSINNSIKPWISRNTWKFFNIKETTNTIEQNKSLKVLKRKLKTGTRNIYKVKNRQGHVVYEQPEIIKIIEECYRTLYRRYAHIPEEKIPAIQNQGSEELPDITEEEIELELKGMKTSKSPGQDGIVSEMLKLGREYVIKALKTLYNACLFGGDTRKME